VSARRRIAWWALWPAGACFVVFGELGFWLHGLTPRETFPIDLGVSSLSIVVGLLLWRLRPENRTGPLLVLAGILWTIGGIRTYDNPWTFGVGQWFDGSQDLVLAHLLIAYPTGRLIRRPLRILVACGYSLFLVALVETMTLTLPGGRNAFAAWDAPQVHSALGTVGDVAGALYAVTAIVVIGARWARAGASGRRVLGPVFAAALVFAATDAVDLLVSGITGSEPDVVFFPPLVARLVIPLAFLFGLVRARLEQVSVGDLVLELDASGAETMQDALARTLRDPSLRLVYRLPDGDRYVDVLGKTVELPEDGGRQTATFVERGGEQLAAIVHDRALLEHPRLVESVVAAARLALDNERLQAQLRTQLHELRASRARIVRAADSERRRLERDLHDGAQQRLLALGLALNLLRSRSADDGAAALLAEAEQELTHALQELRELARGIHPAILTDQGLAAAARTLAARSPIPVTVSADAPRFPAAVETAGYYLIAEALANITRYAGASSAWITIARDDGLARIEVGDDGVGGADAARGTGLAGLADRIGALDGRVAVESRAGCGTTITAEIPCA
jgi:signal transduction histidine kinase/type IV secretory pathway VirB2 component (pilin)